MMTLRATGAHSCRIDWVAQTLGAPMQWFAWTDTPLGKALLIADADALTGLHFDQQRYMPIVGAHWAEAPDHPVLRIAQQQLGEYCAGQRLTFELPLRLHGTAFQITIWQTIAAIAAGNSCSYRALAIAAGKPAATRAAGAATGRNPVSVIVPCHRVMGSDGAITGYSGGLHRKRALLAFEAAMCAPQQGLLGDQPAVLADFVGQAPAVDGSRIGSRFKAGRLPAA